MHAPHYHKKRKRKKERHLNQTTHKQEGQRNIRDSTTMAQLTTPITCPQDVQAHTSTAQYNTSRYHHGQIPNPTYHYGTSSPSSPSSPPPLSTIPYHNYHTQHNTLTPPTPYFTLPYPTYPHPPHPHTKTLLPRPTLHPNIKTAPEDRE